MSRLHHRVGRQYHLKIHSTTAESVKLTGSYLRVAIAHCQARY